MCNLYSQTKSQDAMRHIFDDVLEGDESFVDTVGNLQPLTGIWPDYSAPIVRRGSGGDWRLSMARWGMPTPEKFLRGKRTDPGVTNIRNVASPHWRRWLGRHPRRRRRRAQGLYHAETAEAFCDGHVDAFAFFGGIPLSILYDNTKLAVAQILGDGTRKRSRMFEALQSHYLFDHRFGRPARGNDTDEIEYPFLGNRDNFRAAGDRVVKGGV